MTTSAPPAAPSPASFLCVHLCPSVAKTVAVFRPRSLQTGDTEFPQSTSFRRLPPPIRRFGDSVSGFRPFQGDAVRGIEQLPDTQAPPVPFPERALSRSPDPEPWRRGRGDPKVHPRRTLPVSA